MKLDALISGGNTTPEELGISHSSEKLVCTVCGESTYWFDSVLEIPMCSEECLEKVFSSIEADFDEIDENVDFLLDFNEN